MTFGPDGLPTFGGHPEISDVGASGYGEGGGGVRISLSYGSWPDWITVEARNVRLDRRYEVRITGGNTNDGDADRYEAVAALYGQVVGIARRLERIIENPDLWHADDFEPRAHAVGQPDYVLALYLAIKGEEFEYGRRASADEPDLDTQNEHSRFIGLNTLRDLAAGLAAGGQR